ncbi:MAG: amino acid ABC transporter substrate-binding protein, partial [Acidimicrobiia bacterium]|nr:amino acid ABC transporter substrate-binding protein [Acidimicrobiia bacterium]
INADNIIPVTPAEVVAAYREDFTALVNKVSAAMTTSELAELNRQVTIELKDPADVASEWLAAQKLVGTTS